MMSNLEVIRYMLPDAVPGIDFVVNERDEVILGPSAEEIEAARPLAELSVKREAKLAAEAEQYAATLAAGVTISGITLDASELAQSRFTSFCTLHQIALGAGAETVETPVTIYDIAGEPRELPLGQAFAVLLQYGAACAALSAASAGLRKQIRDAATVEELDQL